MTYSLGQPLGNYRLLRLLGQGGFAEVYLAEHQRLGMKAAIKVLHAHLAQEEMRAFQEEARIIADLRHPHIIRVLDFDVQNGTPFLVLDYASQGSLRQKYPKGTRVPLPLIADYVTHIASALHYAHTRKLIHRDIKPENMLIGDGGGILLSDFGIASIAHSTSSMNTQSSQGTLAYMPPEQIQGRPRPASDQYALAVTVYQWLTGQLPFQGSSTEMIAQHLAVPAPSLSIKAPDLPPALDQVLMTALAKDPRDRYEHVQAFADAFLQALQTPPSLSTETTVRPQETYFRHAGTPGSIQEPLIPALQPPHPVPSVTGTTIHRELSPIRPASQHLSQALPTTDTPSSQRTSISPRKKLSTKMKLGISSLGLLLIVAAIAGIALPVSSSLHASYAATATSISTHNAAYQTIIKRPADTDYILYDESAKQEWPQKDGCQFVSDGYEVIAQLGICRTLMSAPLQTSVLVQATISITKGQCAGLAVGTIERKATICTNGTVSVDGVVMLRTW